MNVVFIFRNRIYDRYANKVYEEGVDDLIFLYPDPVPLVELVINN